MVTEGIYSYYCDDHKELLEDHIRSALSLIYEGSRLVNYGTKIDEEFTNKVRLAVIFHDLGKIFFQRPLRYRNCLSFRGHEYFSTYMYWNFRKNLIKFRDKTRLHRDHGYEIAFAILFHHHAMSVGERGLMPERFNITELTKKLEESIPIINKFLTDMGEKDAYRKTIKSIVNTAKETGLQSFINSVNSLVNELRREINKKFIEDSRYRRISLLILLALITVDYQSSRIHRKPSTTPFSRVINDFYNLYLK